MTVRHDNKQKRPDKEVDRKAKTVKNVNLKKKEIKKSFSTFFRGTPLVLEPETWVQRVQTDAETTNNQY